MLPQRFRITELGKVQGIEDLTIEMVDEEGPAEQAWLHIPVPRRKFHSPLLENLALPATVSTAFSFASSSRRSCCAAKVASFVP